MDAHQERRIIGLVGERGTGKTSLIMDLLGILQERKLKIAGVLSPGIFDGPQKIAIELIHLPSRQGRLLAVLHNDNETGMQFGDWAFFQETLDWANEKLQEELSCDLLVLDEIGPLELDFNRGLQSGLVFLAKGEYKLALLSLRPKCAAAIQERFSEIGLFSLEDLGREVVKDTVLRIANNIF